MSTIVNRIQELMTDAVQTEQDMAEHLNVEPSTITNCWLSHNTLASI